MAAMFAVLKAEKGSLSINDTMYYCPPTIQGGRRKPSLGGVAMGGNWRGYGIAHHAARSGSVEVLKWCLADPDLELTTTDWYDQTVIDVASDSTIAALVRAEKRRRADALGGGDGGDDGAAAARGK